MKGTVYKRSRGCGRTVTGRRCERCPTATVSWAYRVRVGKDANGDWIERRRSGFDTLRAAEAELAGVLTSMNDGTFVQPSELTLGGYLVDRWLPATAPPHVGFKTWADRRSNLEHHVVPRLGPIPLQDLTPDHLNRLYAELLRDGRVRQEGGLSPTSIRRIHAMLRKALNDAVRWGLLRRNVVTLADPPPARVEASARRRSMQTWSARELRTFLELTREHPLHRAWLVASSTGLRRSELLALRWTTVDLRNAVLTVRSAVVEVDDAEYGLEDTQKSVTSGRTIHLDRRTVAELAQERRDQAALRRTLEADWNPQGLVFARVEDGSWWNPQSVSHAFDRAVRRTGLRRIRFHDLRHTHATLLLQAGVNPKVVSERLGHSSVAFTLDTYAHVMPGMQPEACPALRRPRLGRRGRGPRNGLTAVSAPAGVSPRRPTRVPGCRHMRS